MSIKTTIEIEPGDTSDIVLQCPLRGSGSPAKYAAADTLSADIWLPGAAAALATLPASWYTANSTQTGYDQGQVTITMSNAASALQAGVTCTINAYRVMASNNSRTERIATARLKVRVPSPP